MMLALALFALLPTLILAALAPSASPQNPQTCIYNCPPSSGPDFILITGPTIVDAKDRFTCVYEDVGSGTQSTCEYDIDTVCM